MNLITGLSGRSSPARAFSGMDGDTGAADEARLVFVEQLPQLW
jgi:hypothetical protein